MANDSWRTPPEVFLALDQEFRFCMDMAASPENALCPHFLTEQDDATVTSWPDAVADTINPWVFCNPPYSNPLPFIRQGVAAQLEGVGSVFLLNDDMSTQWAYEGEQVVTEIRNITGYFDENGKWKNGRLAFLGESGLPVSGNNKSQMIMIFDPHRVGYGHTTHVTKQAIMRKGEAVLSSLSRSTGGKHAFPRLQLSA